MNPYFIFFFIFYALVILRGLQLNKGVIDFTKWFIYYKGVSSPTQKTAILIPVYKEEKIIKRTINFFKKFKDYDLFFITTEKEKNKLTEKLILRYGGVVIRSKNYNGNKATQLNYAIKLLKKRDYSFYIVYDADSRPDLPLIHNPSPYKIYQQPSLYLANYLKINPFLRGSAIYQTRWSLGFETFMWLRRKLRYFVGHGLIIGKKVLDNLKFTENCLAEDLLFGYQSSLKGIECDILPSLDYSDHAPSFASFFLQNGRWFFGELSIAQLFHHKKHLINIVYRYLEILMWVIGPILSLVGLMYALISPNRLLLIMFFAGLLVNYIAGYFITVWSINKVSIKKIKFGFLECLGFFLRPYLNIVGPLIYLFGLHKLSTKKEDLYFYRTSR